jgi:hypothetical protein
MEATASRRSKTAREVRLFAERALVDFGLMEAYQSREASEREECLRWLQASRGDVEEERRVSLLLDSLWERAPLPGSTTVAGRPAGVVVALRHPW